MLQAQGLLVDDESRCVHYKPILCGSCKKTLTYEEYREKGNCPYCAALFNPACQSHHSYYFK